MTPSEHAYERLRNCLTHSHDRLREADHVLRRDEVDFTQAQVAAVLDDLKLLSQLLSAVGMRLLKQRLRSIIRADQLLSAEVSRQCGEIIKSHDGGDAGGLDPERVDQHSPLCSG